MSKRKNNKSTTPDPSNLQQELANRQITDRVMDSGVTQPHSAKKEALGKNTGK